MVVLLLICSSCTPNYRLGHNPVDVSTARFDAEGIPPPCSPLPRTQSRKIARTGFGRWLDVHRCLERRLCVHVTRSRHSLRLLSHSKCVDQRDRRHAFQLRSTGKRLKTRSLKWGPYVTSPVWAIAGNRLIRREKKIEATCRVSPAPRQ